MASLHSSFRLLAGLWCCTLPVFAAEPRTTVLVSVEHDTVMLAPIGFDRPFYYNLDPARPESPPPEWLAQWAKSFLGERGFKETNFGAPLLMKLAWAPVD